MAQIYSFLPSLRVFQLFGMNPFAIDKKFQPINSRGLKFYSLLQIGVSMLLLASSFGNCQLYLNRSKSGTIGYLVDYIQLVGIRCAHLGILAEALWQRQVLKDFFVTLIEIDSMMKKVEIYKKYELTRGRNWLLMLTFAVVFVGLQLVALVLLVLREEFDSILYWVSYLLPYLVTCLRYFQFLNCIWFIRTRLEILNERLMDINLMEKPASTFKQLANNSITNFKLYATEITKRSKPIRNYQQLILLRQMYDKLYVLTIMINYAFGISNLINIANDFVSITSNCYFIFLSLKNVTLLYNDVTIVIQSIFECLPHLLNVTLISAACHFTVYTVSLYTTLAC